MSGKVRGSVITVPVDMNNVSPEKRREIQDAVSRALKPECVACQASRKRALDGFFLGYRAGFREAVIALDNGAGKPSSINRDFKFCLPHEKMATEAYAAEVREIMGLPKDPTT